MYDVIIHINYIHTYYVHMCACACVVCGHIMTYNDFCRNDVRMYSL